MNILETLKNKGVADRQIKEAYCIAQDLKAAGYNEETVLALYESYLKESTVITGKFTIEKLLMTIDSEQAFADFWEDTNA